VADNVMHLPSDPQTLTSRCLLNREAMSFERRRLAAAFEAHFSPCTRFLLALRQPAPYNQFIPLGKGMRA
jgi:hypothetical protein